MKEDLGVMPNLLQELGIIFLQIPCSVRRSLSRHHMWSRGRIIGMLVWSKAHMYTINVPWTGLIATSFDSLGFQYVPGEIFP